MAALDKLEELNLTQDEIKRFTDAMQKPEFKALLFEYAQEISDPENRARYEMEIREMENERGMDVKFVNPEPGYVIKTSISGDRKAFINVCKNQHIGKPSSTKQIGGDGRPGLCWSLPHSFIPPREDVSKTGARCTVFDFVVHPDTYRLAETNPRFKSMVNDTALEGIKKMFDVDVDAKNLRFPKIKYKGNPASSVIRTKLSESTETVCTDNLPGRFEYPYDSKTSEEKSKEIMERNEKAQALKAEKEQKENKQPHEKEFVKPKYIIKYQSNLDIQDFMNVADARNAALPKNLIIEVDLPMLQSANPISLDVFEKRLSLVSHKPAKYRLDIDLAYPVDENEGSAKFDKNKKKLIVTLPVVRDKNIPKLPFDGKTFEDDINQDELKNNNSEGESNGVGLMYKAEQLRPLIEVISEKELEPAVEWPLANNNGEQAALAAANEVYLKYENLAHNVAYLLPDFECQQEESSLLFTFGTKNVRKESLVSNVLSHNAISVKMTSVGSGGFPVYYSCCLKFQDDSYIDMNNCQANFSEKDGVSLRVTKDSSSKGQWQSYSVGVDMAQLQERNLEMKTEICSTKSAETSLQTILSSDNVIEFDISESVKLESISTEMEIAVVHEEGSLDIHGILKQYSTSEPSDASHGTPTIGQTTIMASGGDAEDVADNLTGLKKSVSFSEEVDRTVFLANQSISQMQGSLKSKQKNVRKRGKRLQLKHEQTKCDISVDSGGDDQSDDQNMGDVAQINRNKAVSDTAVVASESDEIESEVGRSHVNGNRSAVPSDRNNSDRGKNNDNIADEDPVSEKNCNESAENGEGRDCKASEGEATDDHGSLKTTQEDRENESLTSNDCSISQLNTSVGNGALAEKPAEVFQPSAIPHLCESQKSTPAAVNTERKPNLMVEMKNKFVFDLDVD